MDQIFLPAAQLGGTVFTVVAFLWYLAKRDTKWERALIQGANSNLLLAKALQRLTDKVDINTSAVNKTSPVIDKNTTAIDKNTQSVIESTNGNGK